MRKSSLYVEMKNLNVDYIVILCRICEFFVFVHKFHRVFHKSAQSGRLFRSGAVQTAVLQGFRNMLCLNDGTRRQIGDRARYAQHAVVRAGGQAEPLKGGGKDRFRFIRQRTVFRQQSRCQRGVAHVLALSGILHSTCGQHAGADRGRAFFGSLSAGGKGGIFHRLHGNLQIDAVEQRTGQTLEILLHGRFGAGARLVPYQPQRQGFIAAISWKWAG